MEVLASAARPRADGAGYAEARLARHPGFGDSGRLQRRAQERYRFALDVLGLRLAAPDDRWRPVLRDPVVRMAAESALQLLREDRPDAPDDLARVLELAAGYSAADGVPTQIEEGGGLRAGGIWMLSCPEPAGPLTSRLQRAVAAQFIERGARTGELKPGTPQAARRLERACALLVALLPELGPGVLGHITALGLVTAATAGGRLLSAAGGDPVPGVVVMDPDTLEDPWGAAGRLLHEGLHLKLFDLARCTPLFASLDAGIQVPWRGARWPIRRVLASFHVYAHMVLFQAAVRARGGSLAADFGDPPVNAGVSRGTAGSDGYAHPEARLRYLAEQLLDKLAGHLTPAGRQFVTWQLDAIAPLTGWQLTGPAEPPAPPAWQQPHPAAWRQPHPAGGYEHHPGLTLRPAPEAGCLFAFHPRTRVIHVLNLAAWAAFELCDGRDLAALRVAYAGLVAGKLPGTDRQLDLALAQLSQAGLIRPAGHAGTKGGDP